MKDAIASMHGAFAELAAGAAVSPRRISLASPHEALSLFMPARLKGALGAKIVSVFPGNASGETPVVSGIVVGLDERTGAPCALLEGSSLTAIRTGAASGLATDLLAHPGAGRVAIIGAGVQARTQLEAISAVRSINSVTVYSRSKARAASFAREMGRALNLTAIEVSDSVAQAVSAAEIICTATSSAEPVLMSADVQGRMHINAVGSFTPQMREIDPELVAGCYVVVDQIEAALAEAGEVIAAIDAGLLRESDLVELGDLVLGEAGAGAGAGDDSGRPTLFKSVGLAIQDVAAAALAVERAKQAGLGQWVEM